MDDKFREEMAVAGAIRMTENWLGSRLDMTGDGSIQTDVGAMAAAFYQALSGMTVPAAEPEAKANEPEVQHVSQQPAVPIKKSITPDYLICLDDGLKFKSLKRHLSLLGMTPETYRAKWKLPADYPMVAPAYSAQRSEMAKSFGLGKK